MSTIVRTAGGAPEGARLVERVAAVGVTHLFSPTYSRLPGWMVMQLDVVMVLMIVVVMMVRVVWWLLKNLQKMLGCCLQSKTKAGVFVVQNGDNGKATKYE